jgi:micrococcal nuclease
MRWGWAHLLAVMGLAACATSPSTPVDVVVAKVIDGDTIDVDIPGFGRERVRLIGIDTPETMKPGQEPECFGPEATQRAVELLPRGTRVRLERDVEARDPYDRLLAYVYLGTDMVNLTLAREGFAEALSIPPNTAFTADVARAVAQAKREATGLWASCTL